jgi:exonuclease III
MQPSVVCLQEVFVDPIRAYYKHTLELMGYTVCIPRDTGISFISSGLVTAVHNSEYKFLNECFCPYQNFHNVEFFANKGFHVLRLFHKASQRHVNIVNTHAQSDHELSWLFGTKKVSKIRRQQMEQILHYFENEPHPVLVAGDLNCEYSPHPHLRFLHPESPIRMRKATFYSTGEDLDHFGWLPLQWAHPHCTFCNIDRLGPRLEACTVYTVPWSDHAPVIASIFVPLQTKKE